MRFLKKFANKRLVNLIFFQTLFTRTMCTNREQVSEDFFASQMKHIAPPLTFDKEKGNNGIVGVFGGSLEYTGAPYFAAITSLKVGADLVYVFCMKEAATVIKSYSPELIVLPYLNDPEAISKIEPWLNRLHTILIGPGLGRDEATLKVVEKVIELCRKLAKPLVIDADGLFMVSKNISLIKDYPTHIILTPNKREFFRLVGKDPSDEKKPTELAEHLFQICPNLTIVKKGYIDKIFNSKAEVEVSVSGTHRRVGGQGDILSGATTIFLSWILNKECNRKDSCNIIPHEPNRDQRALLASFAGCRLVRESSLLAFNKLGRSTTALDMIKEIHATFEEFFETHEFGTP